jgi:hypothetical protein
VLWLNRYDVPMWENGAEKPISKKMTRFKTDLNLEIGSRKANVQKNDAVENCGRTRGEYSKMHLNF